MSDIAKRRPRKASPIELTISVFIAAGDPPAQVARCVGLTTEQLERRLRQPRMKALVEQARALRAEPPEQRMERWRKRCQELMDDWLRELDTSGILPN
jgi:hypothetical protein